MAEEGEGLAEGGDGGGGKLGVFVVVGVELAVGAVGGQGESAFEVLAQRCDLGVDVDECEGCGDEEGEEEPHFFLQRYVGCLGGERVVCEGVGRGMRRLNEAGREVGRGWKRTEEMK